jgi:hypothetical protein
MKSFLQNIVDPVFATDEQRKKEIWDVEGRLKNGNSIFKFDIRPLKSNGNRSEKDGFFNTKADKIVFEEKEQWIVFDTQELHGYIKSSNKLDFNTKELLKDLSWNFIMCK